MKAVEEGGGVGHLVRGVHSAKALDPLSYSRLKLYLPMTSQWVKCPSLISVFRMGKKDMIKAQ